MKILRLAAAASMAIAVTLLSSGSAQAYPDAPNVTITIPDSVLFGGDTFSYTASANNDKVTCDWTITYTDGRAAGVNATQTGTGSSISGSYKTKVVSKTFRSPIKASCKYDDNVPAVSAEVVSSNQVRPALYSVASGSTLQAAAQESFASAVVTLLPRNASGDNDNNGALPDTGGSNLWVLVLGGALLVAGGGITYATRRRHSAR